VCNYANITHYHLRDRPPFQSISDLNDEEWTSLYKNFTDRRKADKSYNRRFGYSYRALRLEGEEILREKFERKGGVIARASPHYFCLGASKWWKNFCDHDEIRIPLDNIDHRSISFTYPDSFTSMGITRRFGIKYEARPYHGKVFLLHELQDVIDEFGMPEDIPLLDYSEYHKENLETYIEVQVWSDEPVISYTRSNS